MLGFTQRGRLQSAFSSSCKCFIFSTSHPANRRAVVPSNFLDEPNRIVRMKMQWPEVSYV